MVGFIALAMCMSSAQLMMDRGQRLDWFDSSEITIEAVLAMAGALVSILHTAYARVPFINPRMFRDWNFCLGILVAFIMGFRSSAGVLEWLEVAGILVLFTLALTWIAVIPGLTAKSVDGASAFSYPLIFLPFISSAFVPTATMPAVVRVFAENQPVTSIVDTVRSLLNSEPVGNEIWIALAWCVGITLVAYFFAMRAYKRIA